MTTARPAPLYIVSKGRWQEERRLTIRHLTEVGIPFRVIVEDSEHDDYARVVDHDLATLIVLDQRHKDEYDTCDRDGDSLPKGSGPARNMAWDHAAEEGHEWHWTMDDNIRGFWRFNRNRQIRCADRTPFNVMEDFADRYTNIAMAGPDYYMFQPRKAKVPAYTLNTRIYSCNLIRTGLDYRWRARFNEDTDLSLRLLKDGWCTVLYHAFLQWKMTTQLIRGGNTDTIYLDGTLRKSKMIVDLHPDVARLKHKYGRWHHHVQYSKAAGASRLIRRDDPDLFPEGPHDYGLQERQRTR